MHRLNPWSHYDFGKSPGEQHDWSVGCSDVNLSRLLLVTVKPVGGLRGTEKILITNRSAWLSASRESSDVLWARTSSMESTMFPFSTLLIVCFSFFCTIIHRKCSDYDCWQVKQAIYRHHWSTFCQIWILVLRRHRTRKYERLIFKPAGTGIFGCWPH